MADLPPTEMSSPPNAPAAPPPNSVPDRPGQPDLLDQLRHAQDRHALFPLGTKESPKEAQIPVVVAVSGGADSVCLLHLLTRMADEWRLALHVAHLDHGLRPQSGADARFVADLAADLGLSCHVDRVPPGRIAAMGGSLEAAARTVRRTFLISVAEQIAGPTHPPIVALAHNADDQAETVLMNLLRGSGLDGLAAMRPVSEWPLPSQPSGTPIHQYACIVRPLLDVQRTQIIRYLSDQGMTWREDATNQDPAFLRNRLRHEILPLLRTINPNLTATLGRTAALLADEADRLRGQERSLLANLSTDLTSTGRVVLDLDALRDLDRATRRGVLRTALAHLLAHADGEAHADQIEFDHVNALTDAVAGQIGATGPHSIAAGVAWTIAARPARLSLHRHDLLPFEPDHPFLGRAWEDRTVPIPGGLPAGGWQLTARICQRDQLPADWSTLPPWVAFLDGDALGVLRLAVPQAGQLFTPLGMDGHKSLGDFFTDRKIPRALRPGWPLLLAQDGRVAWVCGLQPAHDFRITHATEQIVHLKWERVRGSGRWETGDGSGGLPIPGS